MGYVKDRYDAAQLAATRLAATQRGCEVEWPKMKDKTKRQPPLRKLPLRCMYYDSDQSCHARFDLLHIFCRLESCDNIAFTVYYKLGEVPLDVGVVLVVLIDLFQHSSIIRAIGPLPKPSKPFWLFR